MDLRNFIKETLVQIAQGIEDASDALDDSAAVVNPRNVVGTQGSEDAKVYGYWVENTDRNYRRAVQEIEFDVAVTASEGTETKGGIGVMVGSIGLGTHGKSDATSASQSRIKFSVPMVLPSKK